ncbi:MAG: phosphate acyltransferase PlsX [Anaerolineales bacterium]|jgi:glycerol-3-phosphate acyltransferase PlsX
MMRIVLDAMGSDTHPAPELDAAVQAYKLWGDPILLVGPQQILSANLQTMGVPEGQVTLIHAPDVLEMTDKPAKAARAKAETSMSVGMTLLKNGEADAFVTAGNTGGAMATALFTLGRIRGVKRPAVSPTVPVKNGTAVMLDLGANADCRPEFLVQFAVMGAIYAERVHSRQNPRVGLLSNGEEAGKGNMLVKETFPLLEASGLNFIGNVEPKEIYGGVADVIVTDGFTGNVFLKTSESVSRFLLEMVRDEIVSSPITAIGGQLAKPAFSKIRKVLDPSEYGAAPLLGVDGLVFIGHGRSDAKALVSAIRVARQAVGSRVLDATRTAIRERLQKSEEALA